MTTMRTTRQARCPNCDAEGGIAYENLRDKVYGAPGLWRMRRCDNRQCGAYWSDPAPHPDDLASAYSEYHTHAPDPEPATPGVLSKVQDAFVARRLGTPSDARGMTRWSSPLLALLPQRAHFALYSHFYLPALPHGRLLEIGSGAGRQLEQMVRDGWSASGVDFDPEAVAVARSRGLDVSLGDVRDLGFAAASFDAIVMAQVIEHVYDPVGLLATCARLLRPGGRLVSITPNAESLGHRLYRRDWRGLEPPRHLCLFTRRALRVACMRAGLEVERIDVTPRDAANMLLASRRIRAAGDHALIERPQHARRPPASLRLLAAVEPLVDLFGFALGEELVLTARRSER